MASPIHAEATTSLVVQIVDDEQPVRNLWWHFLSETDGLRRIEATASTRCASRGASWHRCLDNDAAAVAGAEPWYGDCPYAIAVAKRICAPYRLKSNCLLWMGEMNQHSRSSPAPDQPYHRQVFRRSSGLLPIVCGMRGTGRFLLTLAAATCLMLASRRSSALDTGRDLGDYMHRTWQLEQGLPHDTVHALYQSRDGFIWVGTQGGLARFDGRTFTAYTKRNTDAIREGSVRGIAEDASGALWFSTTGAGLVRMKDGRFSRFTTSEGLASNETGPLLTSHDGTLWISNEAVSSYKDGRFTTYSFERDAGIVRVAAEDESGVWLSTLTGLKRTQDGRTPTVYSAANGLRSDVVTAVCKGRDGSLFIATPRGLHRVRAGVIEVEPLWKEASPEITAMLEDRDGGLWLGTTAGLYRLANRRLTAYDVRESLSREWILALLETRDGSLWVGTRSGLHQLWVPRFATLTDGSGQNRIESLVEARDGVVWVAKQHGLSRYVDGRMTPALIPEIPATEELYGLHADSAGTLWVGGATGLYRKDGERWSVVRDEGGRPFGVRGLCVAAGGAQWMALRSGQGVRRLEGGRWTTFTAAEGLPSDDAYNVACLSSGVYVGTVGGLARFKDERFRAFTAHDGLPHSYVRTLYEDADGTLWIGTRGGLARMRGDQIVAFTLKQGLPDDVIVSIAEDEQQNLWIGCTRGVFRVAKKDLDRVAAGAASTVAARLFSRSDGLRAGEVRGSFQPSVLRRADGSLWFASPAGLAVILKPADTPIESGAPTTFIEQTQVDGRELDVTRTDGAEAGPGAGDVAFSFTALEYRAPEAIRFRYRLDGIDSDWVDAGSRRAAYYTRLPPGSYVFRAIAANGDGVWSPQEARVTFRLKPRWYQRSAFRGAAALFALAALVVAYRSAMARARKRERARLDQHAAEPLRSPADLEVAAALEHERGERRRLEEALRSSEEAVRQAQKVETVGLLASGVAHDFNNLLGVMTGFAEMAQVDLPAEHRAQGRIAQILKAGERAAALTRQLLAFSRRQALKPQTLNLGPVVLGMTDMLQRLIGEHIHLETHLAPDLAPVCIDPGQLEQLLMNLAINARDAMIDGGTLTIETAAVPLASGISPDASAIPAGGYSVVSVSDTGSGMDEAARAQLFEPFFTTKAEGKGTGLGLATVHRIVQQNGGHITVKSRVGAGARFDVYFPAIAKGAPTLDEQGAIPARKESAAAPLQTILLVEDEEVLRDVVAEILRAADYTVLAAADGQEALELARKARIGLVLTDVVMPSMNGRELVERLALTHPELRVVFMSGYTDDVIGHHHVVERGALFLAKPFPTAELLKTIDEALAAPAYRAAESPVSLGG
jgi:signal transduction histidine kinase/ligand-binding sensor domain-containing protein/CheY-like chemotaxis protein